MKLQDIKITPLLDTLEIKKIDDATYFSSVYKQYISNSRLGLINPRQNGTVEKFFEGFKQGGFNQSFSLGSAVHELILQPEYFELADDINKPTAKLGAVADELYPIFVQRSITKEDVINASNKIDYYKDKITDDRFNDVIEKCTKYWESRQKYEFNISNDKEIIYLDSKSRNTVISCVDALKNNKNIQDLLHPTGLLQDPIVENENAILLDVKVNCPNGKEFILHLKAKLDNFTIDLEENTITVNDVKTIGKVLSELDTNIKLYHYSREFGVYIYLLKQVAEKFYGLKNPKIKANYLAVSTIPNYYTKVREVTYEEMKYGFKEFQVLLKYVAYQIGYNDYSLDDEPAKFKF